MSKGLMNSLFEYVLRRAKDVWCENLHNSSFYHNSYLFSQCPSMHYPISMHEHNMESKKCAYSLAQTCAQHASKHGLHLSPLAQHLRAPPSHYPPSTTKIEVYMQPMLSRNRIGNPCLTCFSERIFEVRDICNV